MRTYEEIVKLIANFLNKENIPYVMVGAISVAIYGAPRTSQDIDILIMLGGNIDKFVNFLKNNKFGVNKQDIFDALKEKSHFTVFDDLSPFRLDIKGIYTEFDMKTLRNRVKVKFKDTFIYVNDPKDLIIAKLCFGSEKDINDVKGILMRQKDLDMVYLKNEAKKERVDKILDRLINEVKQLKLK